MHECEEIDPTTRACALSLHRRAVSGQAWAWAWALWEWAYGPNMFFNWIEFCSSFFNKMLTYSSQDISSRYLFPSPRESRVDFEIDSTCAHHYLLYSTKMSRTLPRQSRVDSEIDSMYAHHYLFYSTKTSRTLPRHPRVHVPPNADRWTAPIYTASSSFIFFTLWKTQNNKKTLTHSLKVFSSLKRKYCREYIIVTLSS